MKISLFSRHHSIIRFILVSGLFPVFLGIVYAAWLFSSLPSSPSLPGQSPWGTLSGKIMNTVGTCAPNTFLKWFDADLNRICVPSSGIYSGPAVVSPTTPSGYPSSVPSGQLSGGKFGTYFRNLIGVCSSSQVVKSFASDGWKNCVDVTAPNNIIGSHTVPAFSGIMPASSPGPSGGSFQPRFTKMFANTCTAGQVITGFSSIGDQICGYMPINCIGSWGSCNASCSQTYTISTPALYGGSSCPFVNGASRSCTGGSCPPPGSCNNSVVNGCTTGTPINQVAGSCGWSATWNCTTAWGTSVQCSKANAACPINGVCNNTVNFACIAGTSTSNNPGSCGGLATWSCNGSNGGTNASCSKTNPVCCVPTKTFNPTYWGNPIGTYDDFRDPNWLCQYLGYQTAITYSCAWVCTITDYLGQVSTGPCGTVAHRHNGWWFTSNYSIWQWYCTQSSVASITCQKTCP